MEPLSRIRILLVEDDEDDFLIVRDLLTEIGRIRIEIDWIHDVDAAVERLRASPYDAVLTDYRLGASSGLDVVRLVRECGSPCPVILLTGQGDPEIDLAATDAGAADYLIKGEITPSLLERSLRYSIHQHRLLKQVQAISIRDDLTGLYNRRGFFELAEPRLKLAVRRGQELVLLFIDLDGMKQINDSLGHEAGDRALQETAALLVRTFRSTDILARIGGDEFVALAVDASEMHAQTLLERLTTGLDRINGDPSRDYRLELSIGVEVFVPQESSSLTTLLQRADTAMYQQKQRRKRARETLPQEVS